jgi:hypothetical protein
MKTDEIFLPFALVAMSAKTELEKVNDRLKSEVSKQEKAILKKQRSGLIHLIDRCFRLTADFLPVHVSKKAYEYCVQNQLGDIFKIGWNNQSKFEKKQNRKHCELKHEHKTPVSSLIKKLQEEENIQSAVKLFYEKQEIVWVTKKEDEKLPKNNRPNPDEAYIKAEIEIIRNPHPIGHRFQ